MSPKTQSFKPFHDAEDHIALARESDEMLEAKEDSPFIGLKTSRWPSFRNDLLSTRPSIISCIISTVIAGLLVAIIVLLTQRHTQSWIHQDSPTPSFEPYEAFPVVTHDCGDSPASAKAKGCLFDPMSFAWHHPSCYAPESWQEAMQEWGPWIFYRDRNATDPILPADDLELLSTEVEVWTEHSYHLSHCLYAWRRNHMAALGLDGHGGLLPSEVANINHTQHCIGLLQDNVFSYRPGHKVNAYAGMVFNPCVRVH